MLCNRLWAALRLLAGGLFFVLEPIEHAVGSFVGTLNQLFSRLLKGLVEFPQPGFISFLGESPGIEAGTEFFVLDNEALHRFFPFYVLAVTERDFRSHSDEGAAEFKAQRNAIGRSLYDRAIHWLDHRKGGF